jgi:ribosomal protein S18 acetylase RimI-like enzyme
VEYRLYRREDFAALYAIEELCFAPPMRFSRAYMRKALERAAGVAWVAHDEGRLRGFAIAEWGTGDEGVAAYLLTLEVLAEERGQGVGSALLRGVEASAAAAGAGVLWLHVDAENAAAIRVYEARGYALRSREDGYYGRGRAALVYAKALTDPSSAPAPRVQAGSLSL